MEEKDFKIADINADEAENEETSERTDSSADNSVMKQDKTRNHLREHSFTTDSLSEKRNRKSLKAEDDKPAVSDKSEKKKRRKAEKNKASEGTSVNADFMKADESSEIPKGDDKKPDKSEKNYTYHDEISCALAGKVRGKGGVHAKRNQKRKNADWNLPGKSFRNKPFTTSDVFTVKKSRKTSQSLSKKRSLSLHISLKHLFQKVLNQQQTK